MKGSSSRKNASLACHLILAAGLLLRVVVFHYLPPQNNDNHYEVICHIHNFRQIPPAASYNQAYHPPLYHILAACMLHFGDVVTIQSLSLGLSLATLAVMHRLLRRLPWLDPRLRPWCLALPAFHSQFIIYTLLVSNDTLAILLGALLFDGAAACLERPTLGRQTVLALWLGLGLLTKYTFLAFIVPVALMLWSVNARGPLPWRARAGRLAWLLILAITVGCYRFIDNALHYGIPLISNIDLPNGWAAGQRPTWRGFSTLLDVNIFKLIRKPVVTPATVHSWPLMLYGSFWYSFIPECGFLGNLTRLQVLGSLIDCAALGPTLLMVAGLMRWLKSWWQAIRAAAAPSGRQLYRAFALLGLLGALALVVAAGWKHDVWSVFQGRLLFPLYVTFVLLLHAGLRGVARWRTAALAARALVVVLCLCFLIYLAAEMHHVARHPIDPAVHFFGGDYRLDMQARETQ